MASTKNIYSKPIEKKHIISIPKNSPAHKGLLKNSIDYDCKIGTPIYAVAPGIVVWLRKNSDVGGPYKKYWYKGNRIVIKHSNGEFSAYEHLKYRGVKVRLRDKVKKGQLIGFSGNTGYSFGPHLHFEVFNKPCSDLSEGTTLKVNFRKV